MTGAQSNPARFVGPSCFREDQIVQPPFALRKRPLSAPIQEDFRRDVFPSKTSATNPLGQTEQILSNLPGVTEHFLSAYIVLLGESGALGSRSVSPQKVLWPTEHLLLLTSFAR
jgi:hypothetical protein